MLQTFVEMRSWEIVSVPYKGGSIYITGQIPDHWEIPVIPNNLFVNQIVKREIPNSAHVEVKN